MPRCPTIRAGARPRLVWVLAAGLVWTWTGGCSLRQVSYPESINSEVPAERIQAIKYAAETGDQRVIGMIVDRLEDDDAAVRLYAILALEKLTGTRLGYEYYAPAHERYRAVQAWKRYLRQHQPSSAPAGGGVDS